MRTSPTPTQRECRVSEFQTNVGACRRVEKPFLRRFAVEEVLVGPAPSHGVEST